MKRLHLDEKDQHLLTNLPVVLRSLFVPVLSDLWVLQEPVFRAGRAGASELSLRQPV